MKKIVLAIVVLVLALCSQQSFAGDGPEPVAALRPVAEALDFLKLKYEVSDGGKWIRVVYSIRAYKNLYGDNSLSINISASNVGGKPWIRFWCWSLYSLVGCDYPQTARRVWAGAGEKLKNTVAQFTYDESDGTFAMSVAIPEPSDHLAPDLLENVIYSLINPLEELHPVMRRAMRDGMVDWPSDDEGPTEPTETLECLNDENEKIEIRWAPWIETDLFSSTIVSAGEIVEKFSGMNDVGRENYGQDLAEGFDGAGARMIFQDWVKGAQYLEMHYPTISIRAWGPPGTKVSASARVNGFAEGISQDASVIDEMGHVDLEIQPKWDVITLAKLEVPVTATVEYTVACGSATAQGSKTITIQPIGIAELGLPSGIPLAIYVDELHPWLSDIVREAKNLGIANSFGGNTGDYTKSVPEIFAIWKALRNRGLEYVGMTADTAKAHAQHIRQIHESLSDEGANCADGSVLLASLLMSLGFDVEFFTSPTHVFVRVYFASKESKAISLLIETTTMGDVEIGNQFLNDCKNLIPPKYQDEDWDNFSLACENGFKKVNEHDWTVVSLANLRKLGLKALPVDKKTIGKIPNPPFAAKLKEIREGKRVAIAAQYEHDWGWIKQLPAVVPVGYDDIAGIVKDLELAPKDEAAHVRLLQAIDSDNPFAICTRSIPSIKPLFKELNDAMIEKFKDDSFEVGTGLVFAVNQTGKSEDRGEGFTLITIHNPATDQDDLIGNIPVHIVNGKFFIDGTAIDQSTFPINEGIMTKNLGLGLIIVVAQDSPKPFKSDLHKIVELVLDDKIDAAESSKQCIAMVEKFTTRWKEKRDAKTSSTPSSLSWAEVIQQNPDPSVITDAELLNRITATGLPWHVRDKSTGIEMLLVPPGDFVMGLSPEDTEGAALEKSLAKSNPELHYSEGPAHGVEISRAFYLGKTEVTQAQWKKAMGVNSSKNKGESLPVEQVSFENIKEFLTHANLRLPTEAEWEFAARGGVESARSGILDEIAWYAKNSGKSTHPVAKKKPNPLGLYDTIGNVNEWCQDQYQGGDYIVRGGSWKSGADRCRSSYRFHAKPANSEDNLGFRVARTP
jgi:formylglycine-generating enzyme required for sulfatase activity